MNKYLKIFVILIATLTILLLSINMFKNNEHVLSFQANKSITINGLKFMMTKEEVLGIEDQNNPGWGCYRFDYNKEGICITILDDKDTKLYNKLNEIEVTNPKYKIYDINVTMKYNQAIDTLYKLGFDKGEYDWLWKGNLYVNLVKSKDNLVKKIIIGVQDRVSSTRTY